jgi:hypothetical protein
MKVRQLQTLQLSVGHSEPRIIATGGAIELTISQGGAPIEMKENN